MIKIFTKFIVIPLLLVFLFFLFFYFENSSVTRAQIFSATSTQTIKIQIIRPDLPQCSNGLDDDLDGKIDFPEDPGCSSENDNDETDEVPPPPPPSGGGGGGYIAPPVITQVIFTGRAYPLSKVVVLKDGQIAISTIAGPDSLFEVSLTGLTTGNYIFAVYGEDSQGRRSSLFTFPVYITSGATTKVSGIFISPTIAVDKSEVKRGDDIAIFGQSTPQGEITIQVSSEEDFFVKTPADKDGIYLYNFDTSVIDYGSHFTKSKAAYKSEISSFSVAIGFVVGTKNVLAKPVKCPPKADLNNDCRVNLVDFSIAAYWYKRPLSEAFKKVEREKLSGDGKIDLVDFSIMAYYWTG